MHHKIPGSVSNFTIDFYFMAWDPLGQSYFCSKIWRTWNKMQGQLHLSCVSKNIKTSSRNFLTFPVRGKWEFQIGIIHVILWTILWMYLLLILVLLLDKTDKKEIMLLDKIWILTCTNLFWYHLWTINNLFLVRIRYR